MSTRQPQTEDRRDRNPPRLAEWLLRRCLPFGRDNDTIRGDLLEEYRRRTWGVADRASSDFRADIVAWLGDVLTAPPQTRRQPRVRDEEP